MSKCILREIERDTIYIYRILLYIIYIYIYVVQPSTMVINVEGNSRRGVVTRQYIIIIIIDLLLYILFKLLSLHDQEPPSARQAMGLQSGPQ